MNRMSDVDQRARSVGAEARARGADLADTDRAWSDLLHVLETDDDVVVEFERDRFDRASGAGRRWLAVAASLIVVIGLAAAFVAVRDRWDEAGVASSSPAGQWMLPAARSEFSPSAGSVVEPPEDFSRGPGTIAVVGRRVGEVYRNLAEVWTFDVRFSPAGVEIPGASDGWERVDTSAGEVWRKDLFDTFIYIAQQRSDRWIWITSSPADESNAIEVLDATIIDGDAIEVAASTGFEVLETMTLTGAESTSFAVASYGVNGPGINGDGIGPVLVETVRHPGSLVGAAGLAETVRPVTIHGRGGWEASRNDVDGEWTAVVWNADGVRIAVSGHDAAATVRAVAESLVEVNEATWRAATGAGPAVTAPTGSTADG